MSDGRKLLPLDSVSDGDVVYVQRGTRFIDGQLRTNWVRVVVACAAGNTARVVNEMHGIDVWRNVEDLRRLELEPCAEPTS